MNRLMALGFSLAGVVLLTAIGFAFSIGSGWLVALFTIAAIGWIGFGFVVKARLQRRHDQSPR
jgi:hypothetical protein